MREDADAAHLKDAPRSIARLTECMTVDRPVTEPAPQVIGLIDDVLTTGAHFKAAQVILNEALPGVPIVGIFLARRVPEAMEI
jgi:predicted amidophosphoribosyltransferase